MREASADNFFTPDEKERIRRAVEAAEADTAGEIATMIVAESDRYREAELAGSLFLAMALALAVAIATHHVTVWSYLPLAGLLLLPCRLLFRRFPRLALPFAGPTRIAEAVRLRAIRGFFEKRLYRTQDETGILIFMSLLEHKVWILGDRGINARIDPATWQAMAEELAKGIAAGNGCDALCSVIERCGQELARHFPRKADDVNELGDALLTR